MAGSPRLVQTRGTWRVQQRKWMSFSQFVLESRDTEVKERRVTSTQQESSRCLRGSAPQIPVVEKCGGAMRAWTNEVLSLKDAREMGW